MTWQDLGNIGEFVSGIAVVFSLVYVAYQIRQNTSQIDQNTRAVRATAVGLGYNLTFAIFGGTAPMVAVWLIERQHDDLAFTGYAIAAALVSLGVALTVPDLHDSSLPD